MQITDTELQEAKEYLATQAQEAIQKAKQDLVVAEAHVKSVKAQLFLCMEGNNAEREAQVLVEQSYKDAVKLHAAKAGAYEFTKRMIEGKEMIVDLFRTLESTKRAMKI